MILAILQARMASTRLPGKVLKNILGRPMLNHQLERIKDSQLIDKIILATTTEPTDDPIADICKHSEVELFRGSPSDVLERFYQAANKYNPEQIVRLTGDCPLCDPEIIDATIELHLKNRNDYTANNLTPAFPDGLDVEVFSFAALKSAWETSQLPFEREHVTPYITDHPERFKLGQLAGDPQTAKLRLTVDETVDMELVTFIYEKLYPANPRFRLKDILKLLAEYPDWSRHNASLARDESYHRQRLSEKRAAWQSHIKKSLAQESRARRRIPGESQLLSKRSERFSAGVWPAYYSSARGIEIVDLDGNRYLDMSLAGVGANVLGYADPDVDAVVIKAINSGSSSALNPPEEVDLADLLCELHPWADMARFTRSGGEAMALAIRIARAHTGRDEVALCGYHGWHDWYLAANLNDDSALEEHLITGLEIAGVPRALKGSVHPFRFNDLERLESIINKRGERLAAIVLEPIRNSEPTAEFIRAVRDLADRVGALLVIDEISAGFRLNCGGAHLTLGYQPDLAVFSKALGNGYPIAAIIGRCEAMNAAEKTFISSTAWSERIGPVAALATIEKFRRLEVSRHLIETGESVQQLWREAAQRAGLKIEVGGIAPLSHFSFKYEESAAMEAYFIQEMLERGFLAPTSFYSMLPHSPRAIENYRNTLNLVFKKIALAQSRGRVKTELYGAEAVAGFKRLN